MHWSLLLLVLTTMATAPTVHGGNNSAAAAPRYWPKYSGSRQVYLLDGVWETGRVIADRSSSLDVIDPALSPKSPVLAQAWRDGNTTTIPSCIDPEPPGYLGYRGVSLFRTHFDYDLHQAPARLLFQACSFYCRVWINGKEVGDHRAGGYVAFVLEVPIMTTMQSSSTNELVVLVDNRFNATTAPMHTKGDYYHYSGILRSVELHAMPPPSTINNQQVQQVWPWRAYVQPQSLSTVHLTVQLTHSIPKVDITCTFDHDDNSTIIFTATSDRSGLVDLGVIAVTHPRVWSLDDPQLHTISVTVMGATVTERFGLRVFGVEHATKRITINGQTRKLVGWNHHTQWPETAASPTDEEMDSDVRLLKAAGTNYVRGSHYPQDPRWLDRLDQVGIVMWCETLGAGVSLENATDDNFMHYQLQQVNEMLDQAMNHASIMMWAFFNEGPSNHKEACVGYQRCADAIRKRDLTRFVTWASNKDNDKCLDAADVVAFNSYPGWYGPQSVDPTSFWNHFANQIRAGTYPGTEGGKPMVISETGCSGIYEWSDNQTAAPWTLLYQSQIIGQDVEVALANSNISGITLWHFMDFKTYDDTENNTYCEYIPNKYPPTCTFIAADPSKRGSRPGGLNHKGVLDFWRRKKPSYDMVAAMYKNATRDSRMSETATIS